MKNAETMKVIVYCFEVRRLTLWGVLRRVNLVKYEFQVDSIRDQGTDSGYEEKKFQTVFLTPVKLTLLFLKHFTSVENFL